MDKIRVVHYVNQFFGQIGGEDKAGVPPSVKDGPVGVGTLIENLSGGRYQIVRTVICGDNYAAENTERFLAEVIDLVRQAGPQLLLAGPAFAQGRHGTACAVICQAVQRELGIPAVTAMHPLNPGVDLARKEVYILEAGENARDMQRVVPKMIALADKLLAGSPIGLPQEEGYLPRGVRLNVRVAQRGSRRAVDMLLRKLKNEPFTTELPIPKFDRVPPAPPVADLLTATLALATDGGVVPRGNPDHLEAHNASKWLRYPIEGVQDLEGGVYETAHGGYDPVYVNEDPDRVLPLDAARLLEAEKRFGRLHDHYYTTTGNVTAVASAARYGQEIGKSLLSQGVQGVILTST